MLLKIALLALVFVAVHSQGPLGPTNGRQRRSPETAPRDDVEQVSDREAALKRIEEELAKLLAKIEAMPKEEAK
ncbi:unnamed protein product [Nippostrongylus brasiliensis]|uniref:Secreted protein n=1 Tax=Nippostrongylus brasiliensis TaxID=27835 RepID=A0A0N4Y4L3_NIPBR|nr:unnamed protein product [Nippostrongylus brasiliensis]